MMGRYLRMVVAVALGLAVAIAAFCAIVDPYGILGVPPIPGVTAQKVAAADRPRLSKPYQVERVAPRTLVIGSSSANIGYDPDSPAWKPEHRPVYNMGIPGATLGTEELILRHSLATQKPRLVVLSVSFEDALWTPSVTRLTPEMIAQYRMSERMRVTLEGKPNPEYAFERVKDMAYVLLSADALTDSLSTLLAQGSKVRESQTGAGFSNAGALTRWTRDEGAAELMATKDVEKAQQFLRWLAAPNGAVEPVARMARLAREAGAEVAVAIAPSYVDLLEVQHQMGLSAAVRDWRAGLTRVIDREAKAAGGGITLWDFSGVSAWTAEPFPGPGAGVALKWFWDTQHFRSEVATMMVARIEGGGLAAFGTVLTPATLAETDARQAAALAEWQRRNPEAVARIAAAIVTAAKRNCGGAFSTCKRQALPTFQD